MSGLANRRNRLWIRGTERLYCSRITYTLDVVNPPDWSLPVWTVALMAGLGAALVGLGLHCVGDLNGKARPHLPRTIHTEPRVGCLPWGESQGEANKGRTGLRGTGYITRLSNLPSYATSSTLLLRVDCARVKVLDFVQPVGFEPTTSGLFRCSGS